MNLTRIFKKDYGKRSTHSFDCGGRFEILGNHTDHNHGLCLAATSSLAITCVLSKRDDLTINLDALGFSKINMDLSNLEYDENENKSAAMIRGVAKYLVDHNYKIGGFDAASYSTIFPGAGVSSSAAFELLIGQIFNELFNDGKIDKITLAKAGQYSENNYYGKASGLLDQIGVAFGNVVRIDFENITAPEVEPIEFPFDDLMFIGVNTGGDHSSMNALYSKIPVDMKSAAKKMGVEFLRESTLENLKNTKDLTEVEFNRSYHFYTETERFALFGHNDNLPVSSQQGSWDRLTTYYHIDFADKTVHIPGKNSEIISSLVDIGDGWYRATIPFSSFELNDGAKGNEKETLRLIYFDYVKRSFRISGFKLVGGA